ncbi:hypothetical protein BGZ93_001584 [Podila epicladia]|nr:hypothetical protein BGZ92_009182 [Podila epicladia]KAG0097950.1 hypothetical protein BGZ93_001584 [Podila epicladia]
MADANARLQFLWKASHMLLAHSPQVSSLYMSQFLSLSSDRELRLHEDIQSRACAGCGSIFVPGLNSNVKIVTAVTKQQKERRKAVERRKSKAEKMKAITPNEQEKGHNQGFGIAMNKTSIDTSLTNNINKATSAMFSSQPRKATISTKKKIQIIPYTEQMQKQNQAQRGLGINRVDKAEVRSNQSLNHVVYHCKRYQHPFTNHSRRSETATTRIFGLHACFTYLWTVSNLVSCFFCRDITSIVTQKTNT